MSLGDEKVWEVTDYGIPFVTAWKRSINVAPDSKWKCTKGVKYSWHDWDVPIDQMTKFTSHILTPGISRIQLFQESECGT